MKRYITIVAGVLLGMLPLAASAKEPLPASASKQAKIELIRGEIRAQIQLLQQLERKLIAAVNDEPLSSQPLVAGKATTPLVGLGLVGRAKVAGRDLDILFHYVHGKILNPEPVRSRIKGDFVLSLQGQLQLPRDMVVKVWHAGGGVSHDVNTLFVDNQKISSVGDDRSKKAISEVKLAKGSHTVRWELTGGTFRHNMLKFSDAKSGEMLPLGIAKWPSGEVVRIGSDRRGWPIPSDW